ncbi:MAG: lytic transglycosylase domain-containing protein [Acidisphaera sp.]|nr:lytic transglycosylase domain-containing protein [Acidisphaera sp.]
MRLAALYPSAVRLPASTVRALLCLATLTLFSACASQPHIAAQQEAAQYAARAARNYAAPGTPDDPWGPFIVEASGRFDVPERWIREVMRVESGGKEFINGDLTTSPVGAMGLMQVMPQTYDELKARYGLGEDPYDPHNNLLAGAAYIREMYDLYGSPGFLAAYNAGPARLDDYLNRNRPLPDETRRYVAMIGPYIIDDYPVSRSPAEQLASNQLPIDIPPGPRYGRSYGSGYRYAQGPYTPGPFVPPSQLGRGRYAAEERSYRSEERSYRLAALPEPPRPPGLRYEPRVQMAVARPGFHLISAASAETLPARHGGPVSGGWAVQVGAFGNESQARAAVAAARGEAQLVQAHPAIGSVRQAHATLYRARLTGLSREAATQACGRLGRRGSCMVISPDAQS